MSPEEVAEAMRTGAMVCSMIQTRLFFNHGCKLFTNTEKERYLRPKNLPIFKVLQITAFIFNVLMCQFCAMKNFLAAKM